MQKNILELLKNYENHITDTQVRQNYKIVEGYWKDYLESEDAAMPELYMEADVVHAKWYALGNSLNIVLIPDIIIIHVVSDYMVVLSRCIPYTAEKLKEIVHTFITENLATAMNTITETENHIPG